MYEGIRKVCFSILGNRESTIPARLVLLGRVIEAIQNAKNNNLPINFDSISIHFELKDLNVKRDIEYSYSIQEKIVDYFKEHSESIKDCSEQAINYFNQGNVLDNYIKGKSKLKSLFPNIEIMFEKMLINHLYFKQFPFTNKSKTLWEEYISICGVYLFIKYLAIGYMASKDTMNDFVDVMSAAFRLIDHTNFNRNISIILESEKITEIEQLAVLIYA